MDWIDEFLNSYKPLSSGLVDSSFIPPSPVGYEEESPFDEDDFREWYARQAGLTGLDPDPDDPLHRYDYRAAYKAGAKPETVKKYKTADDVGKSFAAGEITKEDAKRIIVEQKLLEKKPVKETPKKVTTPTGTKPKPPVETTAKKIGPKPSSAKGLLSEFPLDELKAALKKMFMIKKVDENEYKKIDAMLKSTMTSYEKDSDPIRKLLKFMVESQKKSQKTVSGIKPYGFK